MLIYAADDEELVLQTLRRSIMEAAPGAESQFFSGSQELLEAVQQADQKPDVCFLDIEMPGMNGLELALELKQIAPACRIVFVTGYSSYAVEAYRIHAHGYIMKPVTTERIREELNLTEEREAPQDRIQVRCFGAFEVFWQGRPLAFARMKTKELLAYLIDHRGEFCTSGEIINAIWDEPSDQTRQKAYLRALTSDLNAVLTEIGMKDLLLRKRQLWAVRTELLDCDYYRLLEGDVSALNEFHGAYMSRYRWAEKTLASLLKRS